MLQQEDGWNVPDCALCEGAPWIGLLECNEVKKVDLLHQTVRDFPRTRDTLSYLWQNKAGFRCLYLDHKAYVAYIEPTHFSDGILRMATPCHTSGILIHRLTITLQHASQVATNESDKVSELLDELQCAFGEMFPMKPAHFRMELGRPKLIFCEEALRSIAASSSSPLGLDKNG